MLYLKKIKKNTRDMIFYLCPKNLGMIYSSRYIEHDRLKLVILPFYPPKNQRKQNLKKNEKRTWRCHDCTNVHQKLQLYDICFLRYGVWHTQFFVILGHFFPFTPLTTWKIKILKKWKEKKSWKFYPFTHVYHKWKSYDVWFLKYKKRQT